MAREPGDRYEPFPGLTKIPGWLWVRMGRGARIAAGVLAAAAVVGVILLIPVLSDVRRDNREDERRERAAARAADIKRVNAIQRPRAATTDRDDPSAPAQQRRRIRAAVDRGAAGADPDRLTRAPRPEPGPRGPVLRPARRPAPRARPGPQQRAVLVHRGHGAGDQRRW